MNKIALLGGKPVRKELLVFGRPQILQPEISEVIDSLESGWIGTGPKVEVFEALFKKYIGCRNAKALNSCTAGLHLSLIVAGINQGEVITTPMTFAATANSIIHAGAKPVFVDVNKGTGNIDVKGISKAITPKTRAIIPVHLCGRPCEMNEVMEIAEKYNLLVIGDAAHAIEARYKGKKIGNISDLTCFSFYSTKNVVCGEGGMITTNNDRYAKEIELYALHGMNKGAWKRYSDEGFKHYEVVCPGYKYNMMDLQAAIGIHQLKRVEENLEKRKRIWQAYDKAFSNLSVTTPLLVEKNTRHARHLYTLLLDLEELNADRNTIQQALFKEGIGTGIHFISLHLHKYYRDVFGFKPNDFPNARFISDRTISLPLSPGMTGQDVNEVIEAVNKVLKHYGK